MISRFPSYHPYIPLQALQHEMIEIEAFRSLVITPTYHLLQALRHEMIEIEDDRSLVITPTYCYRRCSTR